MLGLESRSLPYEPIMDGMDPALRKAWTETVTAADYDQHMANVGQAQANAELVAELVRGLDLKAGSRLLFAGAGTGQMFDYVDPSFLSRFEITFSDINPSFLSALAGRLNGSALSFNSVVDDVEEPKLTGAFQGIILVLVLEHVEWRKALASLAPLCINSFVLVTQENPPEIESAVTPGRELPPSIKLASETTRPELLDETELDAYLGSLGFECSNRLSRQVEDDKVMRGAVYSRK